MSRPKTTLEQAVEEISFRPRTVPDTTGEPVMSIRVMLAEGVRAEELHEEVLDTIAEHIGRRPAGNVYDDAPLHEHGEFYIQPLPENAALVLKILVDIAGGYFAETHIAGQPSKKQRSDE